MKRILLIFFTLNVFNNLAITNPKPAIKPINNQTKKEDNTSDNLGRIAAIITFFRNIIINPNDSTNVASSILAIISTIFNMAADTRQADFNYLELQNSINTILEHGNQEEIAQLQNLIKKTCDLQIQALESYIKL